MADGILQFLDRSVMGLCLLFALVLAIKGPTRQLKIALLFFVVAFAGLQAVKVGAGPALAMIGTILVVNVVVMMATVVLLRHPATKTLAPLGARPWPKYALKQVDEHARAFESLGFQFLGDRLSTWKFLGQERRSFIRFMKHSSGHHWAEIHALDEPKVVARMITSAKQGGVAVLTCDKQANQEFFRDSLTHVQRVATASSSGDMLRTHEALAMRIPGTLEAADDPMARHVQLYDSWVRRLLSTRQAVLRGSNFAVPLRLAFPAALRVMGAWLH